MKFVKNKWIKIEQKENNKPLLNSREDVVSIILEKWIFDTKQKIFDNGFATLELQTHFFYL